MSSDDEEPTVNKVSHKQLLSEINDIVKFQHIKKPKRSEPAIKNDEFHLVKTKSFGSDEDVPAKKSNKKNVSILSIANIVRKNESQKKISNLLQNTLKQTKVLKKPLEKIHADRVGRTIAYDNTKNKLSRWDAVVAKNKSADQLKFPLNQDQAFMKDNKSQSKDPGFSQFRYKTKMVQEIEALHNEFFPKSEETAISNEPSNELLTLEEMRERRKELAKLKMRESYQITKKRLQSKIKSKKYHRLKKKEDLKKKLKEFEELKATNPEAALKELEKIEKQRIQERVNLRHKNTGTWAKNMKVRAQYDNTAKQEIEAQLALSRELTQKQQKDDSSESEDDEDMATSTNKASDNPWLSEKKVDDVDEIFSGYKKFWEEKNANEKALKKLRNLQKQPEPPTESADSKTDEESSDDDDSAEEENNSKGWMEQDVSSSDDDDPNNFINDLFDKTEEKINKKLDSKLKELKPKLLVTKDTRDKNKKSNGTNVHDPKYLEFERDTQMGDIDEALLEGGSDDDDDNNEYIPPSKKLMHEIEEIKEQKKSFMRGTKDEIDPDSFLNIKSKHLITALPNTQELDDADEEDVEDLAAANKMSLAEAFENDDIIHDFVEDVEAEARQTQVSDSGVLPGWGSWGGEGVKNKKKSTSKKPEVKKKDRVIINTTPHESLRKHLVSKVPFPFQTIKDFEASMRIPIGKDFIPTTAHSKLTMESVVTKAGRVIEPMDETSLVKKQGNARKFMKQKRFGTKKPLVKKVK